MVMKMPWHFDINVIYEIAIKQIYLDHLWHDKRFAKKIEWKIQNLCINDLNNL